MGGRRASGAPCGLCATPYRLCRSAVSAAGREGGVHPATGRIVRPQRGQSPSEQGPFFRPLPSPEQARQRPVPMQFLAPAKAAATARRRQYEVAHTGEDRPGLKPVVRMSPAGHSCIHALPSVGGEAWARRGETAAHGRTALPQFLEAKVPCGRRRPAHHVGESAAELGQSGVLLGPQTHRDDTRLGKEFPEPVAGMGVIVPGGSGRRAGVEANEDDIQSRTEDGRPCPPGRR